MKPFVILLFISCFLMAEKTSAQDIIIMKDGSEVTSKVKEVGTTEIKYVKFDNLTGPVYSIEKSTIFMIKYENGTKDVFSTTSVPATSGTATIYFYRPKKFSAGAQDIIVGTVVPDEVITKLKNGQWYKSDYPNLGMREFVTGVLAINPEHFSYTLEPGKVYYIRCTILSQGLKMISTLEMVDEATAKSDMADLKQQVNPK